jgi:hypothetical protein
MVFTMNNTQITSTGSFLFKISVIKALAQLKASFKHNRREIQKELGAKSHIDAQKICLNYALSESVKTDDLMQRVKYSIEVHEDQIRKRIRRDAVLAIEVLFSIPLARHDIKSDEYFKDCLDWTIELFSPALLLTADVHLDEATPHMHVILSCVTPNKLIGSKIKGNKARYQERTDHFFHNVACKYGLYRPPTKLLKGDRLRLAKDVITRLESTLDPMTQSPHYPLIRNSIQEDPMHFASNLGIEIQTTPKKMRTAVQIMTSKGKGSNRPEAT